MAVGEEDDAADEARARRGVAASEAAEEGRAAGSAEEGLAGGGCAEEVGGVRKADEYLAEEVVTQRGDGGAGRRSHAAVAHTESEWTGQVCELSG